MMTLILYTLLLYAFSFPSDQKDRSSLSLSLEGSKNTNRDTKKPAGESFDIDGNRLNRFAVDMVRCNVRLYARK